MKLYLIDKAFQNFRRTDKLQEMTTKLNNAAVDENRLNDELSKKGEEISELRN